MKKLTISAFCMCLCILGCLTGCDSGLAPQQAITSMEINGWTLSSPEGEAAVKNYSASVVEAVKNLEYDGKLYICTIKGNASSVLDRVRDPLFGCTNVNYEDPAVQEYLESCRFKSVIDIEQKHISIEMVPAEGGTDTPEYDETFPVYDEMPPFIFGVVCNEISCNIYPQSPSMQFCCNLMYRSINTLSSWGYSRGSGQIFTGMGTVIVKSGWEFGWRQWQIDFSVLTGGFASFGFEWYGAALQ